VDKKPLTAKDFLKGMQDYTETCGSCRFLDTSRKHCKKHDEKREMKSPRCDKWRYFA
jgi:hypothetical protein